MGFIEKNRDTLPNDLLTVVHQSTWKFLQEILPSDGDDKPADDKPADDKPADDKPADVSLSKQFSEQV